MVATSSAARRSRSTGDTAARETNVAERPGERDAAEAHEGEDQQQLREGVVDLVERAGRPETRPARARSARVYTRRCEPSVSTSEIERLAVAGRDLAGLVEVG